MKGDNALTSAMVNKNSFQLHDRLRSGRGTRLAYTCDKDEPGADANEANLPMDADEKHQLTPPDGGGDGPRRSDGDGQLPPQSSRRG